MRLFSRRSQPAPEQVRDVAEAQVAVGSLSGVAPADISTHVLVVMEHSGRVTVSGTACPEATAALLAEILAKLTRQAHAEHEGRERR